jgi:muramoyltetrapeptide carboxypeptidase
MEATRLIRPAALRPGDRVAVVAPSGKVDPERLARGAAVLTELGFDVVLPQLADSHAYFAASDGERRRQLLDAFADPEVRAVWCARGGYGVARILPDVDPAWMRRHAKLCIGFSDATALLQLLVHKAGVGALHGPMVAHDLIAQRDAGTLDHLLAIARGESSWTVDVPRSIAAGEAVGPLLGGCLTVLASLAGTPLAPSFTDAIALFEDVSERPLRRIDRMLTQLRQARMLDGVRGIVFGTMPECGPPDDLCTTIEDCLGDLGVPIGFGAPVGHGAIHYAVPLGVAVRLHVPHPGSPDLGGMLEGLEPLVS